MSDTKTKWKQMGGVCRNQVLAGDGFYVSYATGAALANLGGSFGSDRGSDETALIIDGKFFILNGDYRKEYEAIADQGKAACKAFYDQKNDRSRWTDE